MAVVSTDSSVKIGIFVASQFVDSARWVSYVNTSATMWKCDHKTLISYQSSYACFFRPMVCRIPTTKTFHVGSVMRRARLESLKSSGATRKLLELLNMRSKVYHNEKLSQLNTSLQSHTRNVCKTTNMFMMPAPLELRTKMGRRILYHNLPVAAEASSAMEICIQWAEVVYSSLLSSEVNFQGQRRNSR